METKTYDCGWEQDKYWFRYRTGAIIVRDGKMLFVKSIYGGYCYMIGGGVHLGEDSKECVEREVIEGGPLIHVINDERQRTE